MAALKHDRSQWRNIMTFFSALSGEDLERYFHLVTEAVTVRRHFDLLRWLQGDVQHFLPHEIMIAAWGDFGLGLIRHDIVSALPGVRTEHSDAETIKQLLCGLFNRWVELGKAPYSLGVGHSGFLLNDSGLQCALGGALQSMRSSMVHGISDERGRHDCLYITFSTKPELDVSARSAMGVLLPYLDAALRQVAHLPRQRGNTPSQIEQSQPSEDYGLSEREVEIMEWVRIGKTNSEVGSILDISTFTVKSHLQRIFRKLDVYNRMQAVTKFELGMSHA